MILLDDDELRDLAYFITCNRTPNQMGFMRDAAEAQLKKVVELIKKDTIKGEFPISEELYIALLKEVEDK